MQNKISQRRKKYLAYLGMMYITIMLSSAVLTNKLILIGSNITLAGALVVPIVFSISDIIAEIYEYKTATQIVFFAFICQLIFAIVTYLLSHLSSPLSWHGQKSYDFVLGPLFRISVSSFIAYFLSSIVNVYILSKWKHLWHGRLFWIRSIGSSTIGEFLFTGLAVILIKYGELSWSTLFNIMVVSYLIKVAGSIICSIPANLVVIYIKTTLHISEDTDEEGIESPFKLKSLK